MKRWILGAIALALNSVACPPAPAPPTPDASDASFGDANASCLGVCVHFGDLGCLEALNEECEKAVCAPFVSQATRTCWANASTKEAARACGQLRCP